MLSQRNFRLRAKGIRLKRSAFCLLCGAAVLLSACGADVDVLLQSEDAVLAEAEPDAEAITETEEVQGVVGDDAVSYVYICGAVQHPGVYELANSSRIYELVELAGGFTDDADETSINLAEVLQDGEMVFIPTVAETAAGGSAIVSQGSSGSAQSANGKVNINTADAATLMTLNGIGETKAAAIVAYREEHGVFSSIEEIMEVSGIGEGTFDKIKEYLTI